MMINIQVDCSTIDDCEIEALAGWFGRLAAEFSDKPALQELFDDLYRLLDSEQVLRRAGLQAGQGGDIDLSYDFLDMDPADLIFLENFAGQMAFTARSRRFLGRALLKSFTDWIETGNQI